MSFESICTKKTNYVNRNESDVFVGCNTVVQFDVGERILSGVRTRAITRSDFGLHTSSFQLARPQFTTSKQIQSRLLAPACFWEGLVIAAVSHTRCRIARCWARTVTVPTASAWQVSFISNYKVFLSSHHDANTQPVLSCIQFIFALRHSLGLIKNPKTRNLMRSWYLPNLGRRAGDVRRAEHASQARTLRQGTGVYGGCSWRETSMGRSLIGRSSNRLRISFTTHGSLMWTMSSGNGKVMRTRLRSYDCQTVSNSPQFIYLTYYLTHSSGRSWGEYH